MNEPAVWRFWLCLIEAHDESTGPYIVESWI